MVVMMLIAAAATAFPTATPAFDPRARKRDIVGPPAQTIADAAHADTLLLEALTTQKPSQAAASVARATGLERKALYARALELQAS